jgi:hypothetical protein
LGTNIGRVVSHPDPSGGAAHCSSQHLSPSTQMREIPRNDAKGIPEFSPQFAKVPMDLWFTQDILN